MKQLRIWISTSMNPGICLYLIIFPRVIFSALCYFGSLFFRLGICNGTFSVTGIKSTHMAPASTGQLNLATGKDRRVYADSHSSGMKKRLVFYMGRTPYGKRTDWVMHEYRLDEDFERAKGAKLSFVLCLVFKKGGAGPGYGAQYGAAPVYADSSQLFQMESVGMPVTDQIVTDCTYIQAKAISAAIEMTAEQVLLSKELNSVPHLSPTLNIYDVLDVYYEGIASKGAFFVLYFPMRSKMVIMRRSIMGTLLQIQYLCKM